MHPADWYDDPNDARLLRWWNGREWTEFVELHTDWPGTKPPVPAEEIRFADIRQTDRRSAVDTTIHFDNP